MSNNDTVQQDARRNLKFYPLQKIFTKRVFLPIIPIFYTQYVGFSIADLGIITSIYALFNIAFNIPAGYLADKCGRATVLRVGSFLLMTASVFYAAWPTKTGIIIGSIIEAIGFAFMSGTGASLVHDSLEVLDREKEYSKVLGRAQSIALVFNALFVAAIPFTYIIDPRLPFVVGAIAFLILFLTTLTARDVLRHQVRRLAWPGFAALRVVGRHRVMFLAILLFGMVSAIYFAFDVVTIALNSLGVSPEHLGWIFAGASLFGSLIGLGIHYLRKLSLAQYMVLDMIILLSVFLAGWSGNVWALIVTTIISVAFWRYRQIIYQDHLLSRYKNGYKSTMLSVMSTSESLNMIWVPVVTAWLVGTLGVMRGFGYIALGTVIVGVVYACIMVQVFKKIPEHSGATPENS